MIELKKVRGMTSTDAEEVKMIDNDDELNRAMDDYVHRGPRGRGSATDAAAKRAALRHIDHQSRPVPDRTGGGGSTSVRARPDRTKG